MPIQHVRSAIRLLIVCMFLVAFTFTSQMLLPQSFHFVYAGTADTIRVALIMNNGKAFTDDMPIVTATSKAGLLIGLSDLKNARAQTVAEKTGERTIRFSLNQFYIRVTESADANELIKWRTKLLAMKENAIIWQKQRLDAISQQPERNYQLISGPYNTLELAKSAKAKLQTQWKTDVAKLDLTITGPKFASVGDYLELEPAIERIKSLEILGWDPVLIYSFHPEGNLMYRVGLGEAIHSDDLNKLRDLYLKAFPEQSWSDLDLSAQATLIERTEVIFDASASARLESHFQVSSSDWKQAVTIASIDQQTLLPGILSGGVHGQLELFISNNKMTVVNQVEMDAYIASLLGAEMSGSWPMEALKAQAVTARTYVLKQGTKYGFAQVSDTTYDQVYKGIATQNARTIQAAQETSGQVLMDEDGLIGAYYYSNAGGKTASVQEVWTGTCKTCPVVDSYDDTAQANKPLWGRVMTANGTVGYTPMNSLQISNQSSPSGLAQYVVSVSSATVRGAAYVDTTNPVLATIRSGELVSLLDVIFEYNAYSWTTAPVTGDRLLETMNPKLSTANRIQSPLTELLVSKRGPSGRAIELQANGKALKVSVPDSFRSMLGGLRSTLFEIDAMSDFQVLGANGVTSNVKNSRQSTWFAVNGSGATLSMPASDQFRLIQNQDLQARVIALKPYYRFIGKGFGHGVGLSQWGAKQLADQGWTYDKILDHYYKGSTLRKDGKVVAR